MVEVASLQKHLPCVAQRTVEIRMCTCGEVHDIDIETVVQLQMCQSTTILKKLAFRNNARRVSYLQQNSTFFGKRKYLPIVPNISGVEAQTKSGKKLENIEKRNPCKHPEMNLLKVE